MTIRALRIFGLSLSLVLFGAGPGTGTMDLVVQHIQMLGPRQWLRLMAETVTPDGVLPQRG
jgi:hypothetical protein